MRLFAPLFWIFWLEKGAESPKSSHVEPFGHILTWLYFAQPQTLSDITFFRFLSVPTSLFVFSHKYVFIKDNGQPVKSIRTAFENACKRTGIKNFWFHDLRHTYNTEMRKAGVHDTITMKQTGHATLQMFMRYNTIDEDDCKDAVQKREAYITQKKSECSLCAP